MHRVCLAVAIVAACTRPPTVERVPAGAGCLAPDDAQIATRQAAAAAASKRAFEAELARLGLTPINLPVHWDDRQVRTPTVQTTVDGVSGEFVVGAYRLGCDAPEPWQLARNARGEIVRVIRMPHAASTATLVACGCQTVAHRCPPPCGMARATQLLHGPLPPGARFAGPVEVPQPVHSAVLTYDAGACPPPTAVPVCHYAP